MGTLRIIYAPALRGAEGGGTADHERTAPHERTESVPHPDQELTGIHPTEGSGHPVLGPEVIPQTVFLCCHSGGAPPDLPVVVGTVEKDLGEGHRSVACELSEL